MEYPARMKRLAFIILILLFCELSFAISNCSTVMSANEDFVAANLVLNDLETAESPQEFKKKIAAITRDYASGVARKILFDKKGEMDQLRDAYENTRLCGSSVQCLLIQEKRARLGFGLLTKVIRATVKSEAQVKDYLLALAEHKPALSKRIQDYYSEKFFSWSKVASRFLDLPSILKFERLRQPEAGIDARRHFYRSTLTSLGFQVSTHGVQVLPKLLSDPAFSFLRDTEWGVFVNTVFMTAVQTESATKSTQPVPDVNARELTSFEGFLVNLPALLHGEKGFWRENKETIGNFAAVVPLDIMAMSAFRLFQSYAGGHLTGIGSGLTSIGETTVSMSFFLSYLVIRWSFIDYKLSLRVLPTYLKGVSQERDALFEQLKNKFDLPSELTFEEYARVRAVSTGSFWRKWKKAPEVRNFYERHKKQFDKSFESEELKNILYWQSRIAWGNAADYTWRIGFQLTDTFLLFRLLGSYIPLTMNHFVGFIETLLY